MDKDQKLDPESGLFWFLLQFKQILRPEEINKIDNSGFIIAFTYCFAIGIYFLLSIICKGVLSAFYLLHTGHKSNQFISLADGLVVFIVTVYALFYSYITVVRQPQFYEEI